MSGAYMLRTGRRGLAVDIAMAWLDVRQSFGRIGLAWALAVHDVAARYRGSVLGPLWITLSMAFLVLGIGLLYSQLFEMKTAELLPYLAVGVVVWGVISGVILEGCETFIVAGGLLRQTDLPLFVFVWRGLMRQAVNFSHHLLIIVAVVAYYGLWGGMNAPMAVFGLLLVFINVGWMALLAAVASARFRDVPQIIASVVQFAMFMTPIFWRPDQIPQRHAVLTYNPFYYMVEAVRGPILGVQADERTLPVLLLMALGGWLVAFTVFARVRRRVVHYL